MINKDLLEQYDKYLAKTYNRFMLGIVKGKKDLVYDSNGKEYIDMNSGIAVNTFGINDESWKEAVISQLNKVQHTSNLYYSEPQGQLAQLLCEKSHMKRVFFSNSGAEANECAIKTARKYSHDKYGKNRHVIISLVNSFHGRTITTLSATGQDVFHKDFDPFTPGFVYVEANNLEAIKEVIKSKEVCGILLEVIQGEGGVIPLDEHYLQDLSYLCKEEDILLIIDEIQTGIGRSGKFLSYMHHNLKPDIVTCAKGLGGGLPIGATLFNKKTEDVLDPGSHGSTFGGNPISCAGAINVVERIDNILLEEVKIKENYIREQLTDSTGIKSVSGKGLMLAVETTKPASEVIAKCMEKGVLFILAKDKVRMLPPLDISLNNLKIAIDTLKEACKV